MWIDYLLITIYGAPRPMQRHRTTKSGHTYIAPRCKKDYDDLVIKLQIAKREQKKKTIGPNTPTWAHCSFVFPRPKRAKESQVREWRLSTPDLDNLEKMIYDS